MIALRSSMLLTTCLLCTANTSAYDFEIGLKLHADRVSFGDPVYVEITIVNRGNDFVSATPKHHHGDRFRFEVRDQETGLVIWQFNADGEPSPIDFPPSKPVRFRQYLFLPRTTQLNHVFWTPFQNGKSVSICGVYPLTKGGLQLRSAWQHVVVEKRNDNEMRALEQWVAAELPGLEKGPKVADFGLRFLRPLDHKHVADLASQIKSGEIADLLQLTLQMQTLFATPDAERDAGNQQLINWLKRRVNIKRQALTYQARQVAGAYTMPSTEKALDKLLSEVRFALRESVVR